VIGNKIAGVVGKDKNDKIIFGGNNKEQDPYGGNKGQGADYNTYGNNNNSNSTSTPSLNPHKKRKYSSVCSKTI
jgi:hypothetical protein